MNLNFSTVLSALGSDAVLRIANAIRPAGDYLFASLLPERNRATYQASSGSMTVRATMAGMVGMDSPYPPTGVVDSSTFLEATVKVANQPYLPEAAIRELQTLMQAASGAGAGVVTVDAVAEALNFLNKVVIQPHIDTAEYLRGEALVGGAIDWTFNQKRLQVNFGVPAANMLANRTGTAAYGGTASMLWADINALRKALRYNVRIFVLHPELIDVIVSNAANSLAIIGQDGSSFQIRRNVGTNSTPSSDARETVTLVGYDKEGEILDPANAGQTIKVPFMPKGKILAVGNNAESGYRVGQGSTNDPVDALALGYTHIGPTVEGGGVPGRWARLFTPEHMQMQLHGQGVSNLMPVIEAPAKIAVASTDMPV